MEAADYINSGHGDIVMLQYHLDLFSGEAGLCIAELVKKLNAPVITTVHMLSENPHVINTQSLSDVCDASLKVIVMDEHDREVLCSQYGVSPNKIDRIMLVGSNDLFNQQMLWFHTGRRYWQLVSDLLYASTGHLRFQQATGEHSMLSE